MASGALAFKRSREATRAMPPAYELDVTSMRLEDEGYVWTSRSNLATMSLTFRRLQAADSSRSFRKPSSNTGGTL